MNQDNEQLDLLGVFHYVVAGLAAVFACFPLIHLFLGIALMTGSFGTDTPSGGMGPRLVGLVFVLFASAFILAGWTLAVCLFFAGRYLRGRRRYMFCLVMGGVECIFVPFGTVLGVFTIITLQRPTVKELFATASPPPPREQLSGGPA